MPEVGYILPVVEFTSIREVYGNSLEVNWRSVRPLVERSIESCSKSLLFA
jgi:hypothetical protein